MLKINKLFYAILIGIFTAINGICGENKAKVISKPEAEKTEAANKAEELPENIKLIIGEGKTKNYYIRIRAIHQLATNLTQSQIKALYKFLYTRLEKQNLKNLEFNALKNEIVLALMKQKVKPADLAGHLVKMYQDKTFDPTWRDYCVQFFGKWYGNAPRNEGRDEMLKNLWLATTETNNSNAGTAVTMLLPMVKSEGIDAKKLSKTAYEVLTAEDTVMPNQISALQVCAVLKNADALPIARELAISPKNRILQMSAIAAIGMLGNRSDLPMLYKFQKSTDIRLRNPAIAAIKKINKRH